MAGRADSLDFKTSAARLDTEQGRGNGNKDVANGLRSWDDPVQDVPPDDETSRESGRR